MLITKLDDYVDRVSERFPNASKKMIRFVLKYGLDNYMALTSKKVPVTIISYMDGKKYLCHTGQLYMNPLAIKRAWCVGWLKRLRIFYKEKPIQNTKYYFGLKEEYYRLYADALMGVKPVTRLKLKDVLFCKNIERICLSSSNRCIIEVDWGIDFGYTIFHEDIDIPFELIKPLYFVHKEFSLIPFDTKQQLPLWNKKLIQHLLKVL